MGEVRLEVHLLNKGNQVLFITWEQVDLGPQCLPLCLCKIDIFSCSDFAGVLRTIMTQDGRVTFE